VAHGAQEKKRQKRLLLVLWRHPSAQIDGFRNSSAEIFGRTMSLRAQIFRMAARLDRIAELETDGNGWKGHDIPPDQAK
jgi:hypothetical protein